MASTSVVLPWSTCAMIAMLRISFRCILFFRFGTCGLRPGGSVSPQSLPPSLVHSHKTPRPQWPRQQIVYPLCPGVYHRQMCSATQLAASSGLFKVGSARHVVPRNPYFVGLAGGLAAGPRTLTQFDFAKALAASL